jgi:hypothetical protein
VSDDTKKGCITCWCGWKIVLGGNDNITNDKFCALRANFKQELFEQFRGKFRKWFSDTNEIMIYMICIIIDDNENGWFPPSDNSGKIYVNARGWTSYPQDSKPTYDQAEHFLRFLDKYVSHAVGNHYFLQWSKLNRSKTFLDKVTASDIAYTILVYENTKQVWNKDLHIKASFKTDEERRNSMHHKNQVSCRKGKASQKFWQWLDRQWARVLPRIAQDLQGTEDK